MASELREIEEAAQEQEGRGDELKEEVENHQQRVAELDGAVKELQGVIDKIGSDESRQALESMQEAKRQTEQLLEEKRAEQEQLLEENARMGVENAEAYREAQGALEKTESITRLMGGDEGGLSGPLSEMQASLRADVQHRVDVDIALVQARQKLQLVF